MTPIGDAEEAGPRVGGLDTVRLILVTVGYTALVIGAVATGLLRMFPPQGVGVGIAILAVTVALPLVVLVARRDQLRARLGAKLRPLADVLVLGILVAVALFYDSTARTEDPAGPRWFTYFAFAQPEVLGLVGLHALTVLAYGISRRRADRLQRVAEVVIHGLLIVGIVMHGFIAAQLRYLLLWGVLPPLLPFATPIFTLLFYGEELVSRLRRREAEASALSLPRPRDGAFRRGPAQPALLRAPRVHRALLGQALLASALVLAAWTLAQKIVLGWGPLQVFTRTYGYTFSRLSEPPVLDERAQGTDCR